MNAVTQMPPGVRDRVSVRNALVSVSDKSGLPKLVAALEGARVPLTVYSTGGTLAALKELPAFDGALTLQSIEAYTGYPEMPGGLVKTLHPRVHGGLLGDLEDEAQAEHMARQGMTPFDLVVVNLYPFAATIARPGTTLEDARRQVDIGGPTMIRAAAKNFLRVAVVVDPADYAGVVAELAEHGGTLGLETRWRLAQKAFRHTSDYERTIADHFETLAPQRLREVYGVR